MEADVKANRHIRIRRGRSALVHALAGVLLVVAPRAFAEETKTNPTPVDHTITVTLRVDSSSMRARDRVALPPRPDGGDRYFFLHSSLEIEEARDQDGTHLEITRFHPITDSLVDELEGEGLSSLERLLDSPEDIAHLSLARIEAWRKGAEDPVVVIFRYSGVLDEAPHPRTPGGGMADRTDGVVGPDGVFLSSSAPWYPDFSAEEEFPLARFDVTVEGPPSLFPVTQGEERESRTSPRRRVSRWVADHPSDGATLVAGPFQTTRRQHGEVTLLTYFYPDEDPALANRYLEACASYLDRYTARLGPYPYRKLAVVENFFPTGYGMPSYTLIGKSILGLSFMFEASLGHEIAHNWWGNSVFIRGEEGNWAEGLTSYCADYSFAEERSEREAARYRRNIDDDYTKFAHRGADFALSGFRYRKDAATQAVGYGKTAMVFHQLRRRAGDERFWDALSRVAGEQRFRETGWSDFRNVFEDVLDDDLGWFFEQWVERAGAPRLEPPEVGWRGGRLAVMIEQSQDGPAFRLSVPIELDYGDTTITREMEVRRKRERSTLRLSGKPEALALDPDFHLFRVLLPRESPPTYDLLLADEERLLVVPTGGGADMRLAYQALASDLSRDGKIEVREDGELSGRDLESRSLVILGGPSENALFDRDGVREALEGIDADGFTIEGERYTGAEVAGLLVAFHPRQGEDGEGARAVAVFAGFSPEAVAAAGRKLRYYPGYSYLVFESGRNVLKGEREVTDSPLRVRVP
jgi:aminopeptidase N